MKITNYDQGSGQKVERRLNDFSDEDYRMLICGQSNCGKSNTLMHMLLKPLVFFDKIYLYTPNHHQDKIQNLKALMDKISKIVGYDVLEIHGQDDILHTLQYSNDNRKIAVFDDLINAPDRIQSKIVKHFTDGRHHGISPIYISQSYYDVPQNIRLNCSHMILYPPATKNHSNLIGKENLINTSLFLKLGQYEFLFLDKEKKTVKKNSDEPI